MQAKCLTNSMICMQNVCNIHDFMCILYAMSLVFVVVMVNFIWFCLCFVFVLANFGTISAQFSAHFVRNDFADFSCKWLARGQNVLRASFCVFHRRQSRRYRGSSFTKTGSLAFGKAPASVSILVSVSKMTHFEPLVASPRS